MGLSINDVTFQGGRGLLSVTGHTTKKLHVNPKKDYILFTNDVRSDVSTTFELRLKKLVPLIPIEKKLYPKF